MRKKKKNHAFALLSDAIIRVTQTTDVKNPDAIIQENSNNQL